MKKLESLWEKLKNNGKIEKSKTENLSLEERIIEKVRKMEVSRKGQYREIINSPIIPIEKIELKKSSVETEVEKKEEWQTYEKNKQTKIKNIDSKSFREELTQRFGKGYNSQKLDILHKELKNIEYLDLITASIGFILLAESLELVFFKFINQFKNIKKKTEKRILETLFIYSVALEEERVLLN